MSAPREWKALSARLSSDIERTVTVRLRALAPVLVRGIVRRTRRGLDVEGRPFVPKGDGSMARLHSSGAMLAALRSVAIPGGVAIGFGDSRQSAKAAAHHSGGRGRPRRRFVGLGTSQRRQVLLALHGLLTGGHR
ncbi:MAG: hypothetical protein K8R90_09375 [Candidatus Cloacimonetes bacterium]|nr:hypothetical protein [Candidatus Cloacimonadota bacterium]